MGFLRYTQVIMPSVTAQAGAFALAGQSADLKFAAGPPAGHNGKKLQTNLNDMQTAGDYAFLNVLKSGQTWGLGATGSAPITPDMLDSNGYLTTMAGNASGGIFTTLFIPSQQNKPGAWIYKWDGNGTVTSRGDCTAVFYTISSVTQSSGIQTINLSSSPVEMAAGQPITLTGIGGTWAGLSNTWTVLDVNKAGNSFRVNTGNTYSSSATLTSAKATFTTTTTVANGTGLNGSGRYAVNYNSLVGGGNHVSSGCYIQNIQSSVDYPHNIRLVHVNDEAALDAGGIFTPLFLSTLANFGALRFLNWQQTTSNESNITNWYTRKPVSYVSYEADDRRANLYAGATTSLTGRTYAASAPAINSATGAAWAGLTDKSTIHVLIAQGSWTSYPVTLTVSGNNIAIPGHTYINGDQVAFFDINSQTCCPANITGQIYYYVRNSVAGTSIQISATSAGAIITPSGNFINNPTSSGALYLNVGGTGAKLLMTNYSNIIGNPQQSYQWPTPGTYASLSTVHYDSTLDAYMMQGGSNATGSAGILNLCPYEVQLALCTAVGAHPHWVTPIWGADPMTDLMPSMMKYAKDNAPAWMIPRYEPPNETWNNRFVPYSVASHKAIAYGWGNNFHAVYGKVLSALGQAAATVYGGKANLGTTYAILGGVQTSADAGDLNNFLENFSSSSYIGTIPQSPLTGSWGTITFSATAGVAEAHRWTSHIVVANYITSNVYYAADGPQTRTALAAAFHGSQVTATIAAGVMTVAGLGAGEVGNLTVGATIFGPGVPAGVTITSLGTGTGGAGTYNLSQNFSIAYSQTYTAGVDLTAPLAIADSLHDTIVNATITGANFVVNSLVSGTTVPTGIKVCGGTIARNSGVYITGGTYPNYTLNSSPGNQTASFSIGLFSIENTADIYLKWATWANTNFGIKKITAYEGGYSNDYGPMGTAFDLTSQHSKRAPNLQTYTTQNYDNFRGIGSISYPVGVTAEFPSAYLVTGAYGASSAWSVLDDIYQTSTSAQWSAILAY